MTDFSFFNRSLQDQRIYSTERSAQREILLQLGKHGFMEVEQRGRYEVLVTGSHVMTSGNSTGVAEINERFDISLPDDFDAFYRLHDGGILLFQEIYRLMPVEEIIREALWMQNRDNEPTTPWHFIRFCDLREIGHIGLRLCADGCWRIMLADTGYSLYDLINDRELHDDYTWDGTFTLWLKRMCATDGWPSETRVYVPEDPPLLRLE